MNERDGFLKALAENEDDTTTRLVYADWLDEQGEHEEADRQRKWPAAKEWLVKLCRENNYPDTSDINFISYEELLTLGREAIEGFVDVRERIGFGCGANDSLCDALRENAGEFWKNISVVTGIAVSQEAGKQSWFGCSC